MGFDYAGNVGRERLWWSSGLSFSTGRIRGSNGTGMDSDYSPILYPKGTATSVRSMDNKQHSPSHPIHPDLLCLRDAGTLIYATLALHLSSPWLGDYRAWNHRLGLLSRLSIERMVVERAAALDYCPKSGKVADWLEVERLQRRSDAGSANRPKSVAVRGAGRSQQLEALIVFFLALLSC